MQQEARFVLGDCTIDPSTNTVAGPRGSASIQPRLTRILVCLADTPVGMVSRQSLLEAGWFDAPYVADEALTKAVSLLRKALAECSEIDSIIRTVPKAGYILTVTPERAISERTTLGESALRPPAVSQSRRKRTSILRTHPRVWAAASFVIALPSFILGSFLGVSSDRTVPPRGNQPEAVSVQLAKGDWQRVPELMAALSDEVSIVSDSTWTDEDNPSKMRRRISMAARPPANKRTAGRLD